MTIRANDFIAAAATPGLLGTPYAKMDCQALVEKMLSICGVKRNWKGSNDMARDALSWLGTIKEAEAQYATIPPGAWLFRWANDGGEKKRGYTDGKGNFFHVGVYLGGGVVFESTTGGVQYSVLSSKWTHVGLATDIDYTNSDIPAPDTLTRLKQVKTLLDAIIIEMEDIT